MQKQYFGRKRRVDSGEGWGEVAQRAHVCDASDIFVIIIS